MLHLIAFYQRHIRRSLRNRRKNDEDVATSFAGCQDWFRLLARLLRYPFRRSGGNERAISFPGKLIGPARYWVGVILLSNEGAIREAQDHILLSVGRYRA
jgi:hypothetical protein